MPTLKEGNLVFYTRINAEYRRGDVVSVRIPSGEYYVKRIIALGADTVELKGGKVYVNGALLEQPYAAGETREQTSGNVRYPKTVQHRQIFVMGDNRSVSMDISRSSVNRYLSSGKPHLEKILRQGGEFAL